MCENPSFTRALKRPLVPPTWRSKRHFYTHFWPKLHAFRYFDTTRIAENKGLEWEFVLILARAARERGLVVARNALVIALGLKR